MKKILLFLSIIFVSHNTIAQSDLWYFGVNGSSSFGLDFSGGGAPVQVNGVSAISYYESVSVVSDGFGNPLFYTNGIRIYDASHVPMSGNAGPLTGTQGNTATLASSVQGAYTVKKPGSDDIYFLFTSQSSDGPANGFRVNRIDLSQPGNGTVGSPLGRVMRSDSLLAPSSTEMMTGWSNCNGDTAWVIAHAPRSYDFYVVLITSNGIQSVSTQNIPTPNQFDTGYLGGDGRGSIDLNPQGTKLIMTGQWPIGTHLMDFNTTTGIIGAATPIRNHNNATFTGYGSEFSPDGTKAYFSSNIISGIWQYDLTNNVSTLIAGSNVVHGELIRGLDGKIYIGKPNENSQTTIGVIDNPNAAGPSVSYNPNAIAFTGGIVSYAMPQGFSCPIPTDTCEIIANGPICDTSSTGLQFTATPPGNVFGGGAYINASGFFDPSISGAGQHWITYSGGCFGPDSFLVQVDTCCPPIQVNDPAGPICVGDSINLSNLVVTGTGNWTIISGPGGATIDGTNTYFDASSANSGTFTVAYLLNPAPIGSCTPGDTISIIVNGLPNINLTPANPEFCSGDSVLLDAGITSGVTYQWNPTNSTTQTTYATTSGNYKVIVTNSTTGCIDSADVTVTELALPNINLTASATEFCFGDSVVLNAGISGNVSYNWSPLSGSNQTLTVTDSGTYKVIVTDNVTGCIDSASITISQNPLPSVNLTSSAPEFCFGDSVTLDAGNSGNVSYSWSPLSGTNQTLVVTDGGTYKVIVTDNVTGCIDSASITITENPLPIINLTPANPEFCSGDSVLLDAGISSGVTYLWNPTNSTTQTTYATTAGNYKVIVTNSTTGCIDSAEVTVTELALPNINLTASATEFCFGDSVILDAGISGNVSCNWSPLSGSNQTLTVTDSGTYKVIVSDNVTGCIDSASITISQNPLPTVNLTSSAPEFCFGDSVTLDAGNSGNVSYSWSPLSGTNQTLVVTDGGTYKVIVTDNVTGCIDSASITITENPLPIINLTPANPEFCSGDSVLLDAGISSGVTYLWNPTNSTTQTTYATTAGNYKVIVTNSTTGCIDSAEVTVTELLIPVYTDNVSICDGEVFTFPNGDTTTIAVSNRRDTLVNQAVNGCDSIVITNLTVLPTPRVTVNPEICSGETYTFPNGDVGSVSVTGRRDTLVNQAANGCDSIIITNLNVKPVPTFSQNPEICSGESFIMPNGDVVTQSTSRSDTLIGQAVNGCDSIVVTNLIVNPTPIVDLGDNRSTCLGGVLTLNAGNTGATFVWNDDVNENGQTFQLSTPDSLYKVVVTTDKNCSSSDSIYISTRDSLNVELGNDIIKCANETVTLNAGEFNNQPTYNWSNNLTTSTIVLSNLAAQNNMISVIVTDTFNCKGVDSIRITVLPIPTVDIVGGDTSFCSLGKDTYEAFISYTGARPGTIEWSNGSNDTSITVTFAPTSIWVTYSDSNNCTDGDTIRITEYCEPTKVNLPNVFIPGSDLNGMFEPIGMTNENYLYFVNNVIESDFQVYNRWGIKVHQSQDFLPRWDGMYLNNPVSAGTYFWIWKYKDSSLKTYELNGFVQVIQNN